MRRDDLYITVPSFFRCPISLDVMKSPVSLCTGVTYDRASIQRWLDGGNNTCPATMQVLNTKEVVPNRTLQRLIALWSESVRRRVDAAELPPPTRDEVEDAIRRLRVESEEDRRLEMVTKIVRFARESEENEAFLARKEDFLPMLVDLIRDVDARACTNAALVFVQKALRLLSSIRSKVGDRERLGNLILRNGRDCLAALLLALQRGNLESKIDSISVLESVAVGTESKLLISHRDGLLAELTKWISAETDSSLIEATLSCLITLSTPRRVRLNVIGANAVTGLKKLLTESTNLSVKVTEKALKLLEMLSYCKEGRSEMCEDATLLQAVMRKVLKVSTAATEHAVTILWSVCYLFEDERAQESVASSNGVTKLLLLLQSNCSNATRQMSTDLLKVFKVGSKSCLSGYDTKTTHIMPF